MDDGGNWRLNLAHVQNPQAKTNKKKHSPANEAKNYWVEKFVLEAKATVDAATKEKYPEDVGSGSSTQLVAKNADSSEPHVSNSLKKTLGIWACRIIGPLGTLGGIGELRDALSGKAQNPDDPGVGGSIVTILACVGMTAFGFWRRKKKTEKG